MSEPIAHRFKWEEHEEWQYSDGYDATGAPNDPDYFAYEPLYTHPVAEDYSLTDDEIFEVMCLGDEDVVLILELTPYAKERMIQRGRAVLKKAKEHE